MTNSRIRRPIIWSGLIVASVAFLLSAYLACKHAGICQSSVGCLIDGADGCAELGRSEMSRFLGIPIAFFGVFYYAFVLAGFARLLFKAPLDRSAQTVTLLMTAVVFGVVIDGFLAYRNFMVLIVPCLLCFYTYVCQALILVLCGALFVIESKENREVGALGTLGRSLLTAWPQYLGAALATLAVIVSLVIAVSSSDGTSADRGVPLLNPEQVPAVLADFERETKPVGVSDVGLDSLEGSPDGYIVVHKWADFRCPHCLHMSQLLQYALRRWPGRIRVYYRHFPLDGSCNPAMRRDPTRQWPGYSCTGARAALCAPAQNIFPAFYHALFDLQERQVMIEPEVVQSIVQEFGGDWPAMQRCMEEPATEQKLLRDINQALAFEINSTPTVIVNGRMLPAGTPSTRAFIQVLDALVIQKEGAAAIEDFRRRHPDEAR